MRPLLDTLDPKQRINVLRFAERYGFEEHELEQPMLIHAFADRLGVHRNTVHAWCTKGTRGIKFEPLRMGTWRRFTLLRWILWQLAIEDDKQRELSSIKDTFREIRAREKRVREAEEKLRRQYPAMFKDLDEQEEEPCLTAK